MFSAVHLLPLVVVLLLFWIVRRRRWQRMLWKYGIPGPEPHFIFGHLLDLQDENVKSLERWVAQYGKVISAFEAGPTIYVADPELAHRIQVTDFRLFPMRRKMFHEGGIDADPMFDNLIVSESMTFKRWKEQRALITSGFTSAKVKASSPHISEAVDDLLENMAKEEGDQDFDICELCQRLTMDTIGSSAFGTNFDVQHNPDNEFFQATKRTFDNITKSWYLIPTFVSILFPEFVYFLLPIRKFLRVFLKFIGRPTHFTYQMDMCRQIVDQRKRETRSPDHKVPDDFLQRLIDATITSDQMENLPHDLDSGRGASESGTKAYSKVHRMTDDEVVANATVLFDAGYGTTSSVLSFMFHVLVNRQDIQDEVRREVLELRAKEGQLDYNTCHSLPYLESVMYETMRYFPPVTAFVNRQSTVDYKYKNIVIPKDVAVEIAVPCLHFDPEIWDDPQTFDPLRFYGTNKSRIQSPGYQAFGAGPRNCLGMRFAIMEIKLTVAKVLSVCKLIPGPRTQAFADITIDSKFFTQEPKHVFVKMCLKSVNE